MDNAPDLALTRALLDEKFVRLHRRDLALFRSIVAFDMCVGPQLLAVMFGLPADIVAQLERMRGPRVLVTTPVHLRSLVFHQQAMPPLAGALLKNEQDMHLFERLIYMNRTNR